MLSPPPTDRLAVEIPERLYAGGVQMLVCEFAQRTAQPVIERYSETALGTVDHPVGHPPCQQLAKSNLAGRSTGHAQIVWHSPRHLDHLVVEQWRAHFETGRHRSPIDLHQHIVRQIAYRIEEHHLFELAETGRDVCGTDSSGQAASGVGPLG